jgi:hypothetical protein
MQQVGSLEQVRYPVQFSVENPDRPLNRLSTAFRIVLVIPIAIVLSADPPFRAVGSTLLAALPAGPKIPAGCLLPAQGRRALSVLSPASPAAGHEQGV